MRGQISLFATVLGCWVAAAQPGFSDERVTVQTITEHVSPATGSGFFRIRTTEFVFEIREGATPDEGIMRVAKGDTWETLHGFQLNGGRLPEPLAVDEVLYCGKSHVLVLTQTLYSEGGAPVFVYERSLLNAETGEVIASADDAVSFDARGALPAAAVVDAIFPACTD